MPPTPHPKTPPISPIFIADNVTLVVSREKDGKLQLVYAPIDAANVVLLGTAPPAEVDSTHT